MNKALVSLALLGFVASFLLGKHFGQVRTDQSTGVQLAVLTIANTHFQLRENKNYLSLLERNQYGELHTQIIDNTELLESIFSEAAAHCNSNSCSKNEIERIKIATRLAGAENSGE